MLLIEDHADSELALTLEQIKTGIGATRCIYIHQEDRSPVEGLKEIVITALEKNIASFDTQVYFLDDGDIVILAGILRSKDYRELVCDLAEHSGQPSLADQIELRELPLHLGKLIKRTEEKIDRRRKKEDAARKQREQTEQERKRSSILNGFVSSTQEEIQERRSNRQRAELMIIEDDAFSRRLVENVVQKQYGLIGLGEATHALETYARLAPDVLFLDINLPDVTGHELLARIMKIDPSAYVVMLSGNADKENITQALSLGAKGFVAKPFTREKIFQYIERCPSIAQLSY